MDEEGDIIHGLGHMWPDQDIIPWYKSFLHIYCIIPHFPC